MNFLARASGFAFAIVLLPMLAEAQNPTRNWPTNILTETFGISSAEQIDAPISDVLQGCPKRDCIPSIDAPKFLPADAAAITSDEDLVMGIEIDGDARAYPIHILNLHEVVNDRIGDLAFAVTWCPLCGSGLVFDRSLDGNPVEFGVSGLLHNSDLILYDRASSSLWQQITGRAIAGPRRGETLRTLPVSIVSWAEWRDAHPQTQLLSTDTGHERNYANKSPYGDYDSSERLLFPASGAAGLRLHPKTVIHGAELGDFSVAVSDRALQREPTIRMTIDEQELLIERGNDGTVRISLPADGSETAMHRMFWFAWISFHPGSVLYDPQP